MLVRCGASQTPEGLSAGAISVVFAIDSALESHEPLKMNLRQRTITMIGQDTDQIELQSRGDALGNICLGAIENRGRQVR